MSYPRAYYRILPGTFRRKAFGTERHPAYPPAAVAAFYAVLDLAEQQAPRGRFESERLLRVLIEGPKGQGRVYARQVPFLIAQHDLIRLDDGTLYVDGWDELQEGNWEVAERMRRHRARQHVTPTITQTVTVKTVTLPSERRAVAQSDETSSEEDTVAGSRDDAVRLRAEDIRRAIANGRPDHAALLERGWWRVTDRQETVLSEINGRHDIHGREWAADIIRSASSDQDPLDAVMAADRLWQAERRKDVDAEEADWAHTKATPLRTGQNGGLERAGAIAERTLNEADDRVAAARASEALT